MFEGKKMPRCHNCGREADPVFVCAGCESVIYCCEQCQSENWLRHRTDCERVKSLPISSEDHLGLKVGRLQIHLTIPEIMEEIFKSMARCAKLHNVQGMEKEVTEIDAKLNKLYNKLRKRMQSKFKSQEAGRVNVLLFDIHSQTMLRDSPDRESKIAARVQDLLGFLNRIAPGADFAPASDGSQLVIGLVGRDEVISAREGKNLGRRIVKWATKV